MTSASTGSTTSCEHCDGSLAHEHVDVAEVRSRLRSLTRWAVVRALILVTGAVVGVAAVALSTTARAAAVPVATLVLAGVTAWLVVTVLTLAVAGLAIQRREGASARHVGLALGSVVGAAATPVTALAVALLSGAPWWMTALAAGVGWSGAAVVTDLVGGLRLRAALLAESSRTDLRRLASAGRVGSADPRQLAATLLGAAVFAAWVSALDVLPALVVVLVPLHGGLAARARAATAGLSPSVAASS